MIDHVSLHVSNYDQSKAFYLEALKPLGYELLMEFGKVGGFGINGKADFWVIEAQGDVKVDTTNHIAFSADDHKAVDAFYEAALQAGGKDNGKPGPRAEYHENYYGAFVLDPDGNNMEAVCHKPE